MICAGCGGTEVSEVCGSCGASGLLRDRYALEEILGHGAQGTAYRALDLETGGAVVIKELPVRPGTSAKALELFHREVRVLQQLSHPQIPTYIDHFEAGTGRARALYIAQDFIEGTDFASVLAEHRFTEREVLQILAELLPLFAYLHGLTPPVVHRDVKPRNVMRRPDGSLVLVDFGAVRDALKDPDLGGSTVAGTFGYMAPEQFAGDAEPASDLYGLGAFAVALLTRKEPHTLLGPTNQLEWRAHTRVRAGAGDLIDALVEPDVRRRLGSAEEALQRVEALLSGAQLPVVRAPAPVAPELGGTFSLALQAVLDGELEPEAHDRVVGAIEGALGLSGRVRGVGRSLRWHSDDPNRGVSVSVEPRAGRTIVRIREPLGGLAGGLFGGLGGGMGGGFGGGLGWLMFAMGGPAALVAWLVLTVGGSLALATALFATVRRRRAEGLQRALDEISEVVRGL